MENLFHSTIFMRQRQQFCKRDDIWPRYCLLHTIGSNIYRLDTKFSRGTIQVEQRLPLQIGRWERFLGTKAIK